MADVLGAFADAARKRETQLVHRLVATAAADSEFESVLRGAVERNRASRQRLDAIEAEIKQAAVYWRGLETPAAARQFQQFLVHKTLAIHKVVADGLADSQAQAEALHTLGESYAIRGDLPAAPPRAPTDDSDRPGDSEIEPGDIARAVGEDPRPAVAIPVGSAAPH